MTTIKKTGLPTLPPLWGVVILFLVGVIGCGRIAGPVRDIAPATLTVGYGLTTASDPLIGAQQAARNVAVEPLIRLGKDGRPVAALAESWSPSEDGLTWSVRLRPSVTFSDGKPVTAYLIRDALKKSLPQNLGPAFEDVTKIEALSERELAFSLKQASAFLIEGLDVPIEEPGSRSIGTGPFYVNHVASDQVVMLANANYYGGKPVVDRVVLKPYASIRSAWADLLRGQVDMLYEVGIDALDSLEPSSQVRVFTFQRHYALIVLLNFSRPFLQSSAFRRKLNAAIDRQALVTTILKGHGIPADGPMWPYHWAFDSQLPRFTYEPQPVSDSSARPHMTCLIADPSLERLGLAVQKQLQAVGVDVELEAIVGDKLLARLESGNFDAVLTDAGIGPTLVRPYLFWHSGSPYNWGRFASESVDAALDSVRHATSDVEYKTGVAALQHAIIDDPPAIFLAWSERARAVSRRFDVPSEPGVDIWGRTLAQWKPAGDERNARRH